MPGTHGFLPLLSSEPGTVRAQVLTAVQEHERIFGASPRACGCRNVHFYPGLDEVLAEAGIRYFFVDSHGIEHAEPRPLFGVNAPLYCPTGVAAFGRHPMTSSSSGAPTSAIPPITTTANTIATSASTSTRATWSRSSTPRASAPTPASSTTASPERPQRQAPVQPRLGTRDGRAPCHAISYIAAASKPIAPPAACRFLPSSSRRMTRSCSATGGSRGRSGFITCCASLPKAAIWPWARRANISTPIPSSKRPCRRRAVGQERLQRALGQCQDRLDVAAPARGGGAHAPGGPEARRIWRGHGSRTALCARQAAS